MARPTAGRGALATLIAILETIVVGLLLIAAVTMPSTPSTSAQATSAPDVSDGARSRPTDVLVPSSVFGWLESQEPRDVAVPRTGAVTSDPEPSGPTDAAAGRVTGPSASLPATDTVSPAVDGSD